VLGSVNQSSPAYERAGEADEAVADIEAALPAHGRRRNWCSRAKVCSTTYRSLLRPFTPVVLRFAQSGFGVAVATRLAEGVAVIAFVGKQNVEATPGRPGRRATGGKPSSRSPARLMSGAIAPLVYVRL
jgi:alkanesulfonate monooxygenase SsuD/methylene tetrahydromethanopterin reductase-like flavin-dependent oxidoreductase (luciferase family)